MYPLVLTGMGILGNAYVLGEQIKDVENKLEADHKVLGTDLKDVQKDVRDVQEDVKDLQKNMKDLLVRQADQEAWTTTLMMRYMKGCGK